MRPLSDLLELIEGNLCWKYRPVEYFETEKEFNRWNKRHAGKIAGALFKAKTSVQVYRRMNLQGRGGLLAHRAAWEVYNGPIPEGMLVDHIDGNGLNNTLSNLRLVDNKDSAKNRPVDKNNTSGQMGVFFYRGYWHARISSKGVSESLGRFIEKEDAIKARLEAEERLDFHENHGRVLLQTEELI